MPRRNDFLEFLKVLLSGGGPSGWLWAAFALGLLFFGILANLIFSLVLAPAETWPGAWRPAVIVAAVFLLAYVCFSLDRRRKPRIESGVDESRLAPPHKGLIWLFGPGPFDHLLFALRHHVRGGGGAHCWLVMQNIPAIVAARNALSQRLIEEGLPTQLHEVYIERLEVEDTSEAVRTILERRSAEVGLAPEDVIADITGGTKPLTAGMVLAALTAQSPTGEVELEYIESDHDDQGGPIPGTQHVVLVDIRFRISREA